MYFPIRINVNIMCGIAGLINKKKNLFLEKNKIFNLMNSRGPDEKGYYKNIKSNYCIHLFHSRLTILDDNKRSNQPFKFKNYVMIYNGELYNYQDLKNELKKFNYKFYTTSDTEVFIKAYDRWGSKCLIV